MRFNCFFMGEFFIEWSRGGYYFTMKSKKGTVILTSENFKHPGLAYKRARSVITNKSDDGNYQRANTSDGKWYFVFKGTDGEIIGVSELYESIAQMEKAVYEVKKTAKVPRILINFF